MKILPLPDQTRLESGFSHKVIVDYTDLSGTAATTKTLTFFPDSTSSGMTAGSAILRTGMQMITPFVGTSITAVTLTLGDGATAARYIAAASTDLVTAAATNTKEQVASGTGAPYAYTGKNVADGNNKLLGLFTATGANLTALTAGKVEIYFCLVDMAGLSDVK